MLMLVCSRPRDGGADRLLFDQCWDGCGGVLRRTVDLRDRMRLDQALVAFLLDRS